jgi:hypothetical protein
MEQSLFIELIHRTKGVFNTINKLTQLSREKFGDREFREFFYKTISNDIEENSLLLNTFVQYIESTTSIPKKDTIVKLFDEVLKRHQVRLEERRIKILKTFEGDLPETIVPDEQLKFIFDSLLQFVIVLMPSGGNVEFLAKSVALPGSYIDKKFSTSNGECIAIVLTFTNHKTPRASEEVLSDLVYRLVEMIVQRNHGKMNFEVAEKGSKNTITLKVPIERRKVVHYRLTNE